jgi:hypothetical protein
MVLNSGAHRRDHTPSKPLLSRVHCNLLLVLITATITWTLSSYMHNSVLSSDDSASVAMSENALSQIGFRLSTFAGKRPKKPWKVATWYNKIQHVFPVPVEKPKGHIDYSDYTGPSKVYAKFEHPFPCFQGEPDLMVSTPAHEGILFQRPMKTGSTTMTGIVLRLVHSRGKSKQYGDFDKCKHRSYHGTGKELDYYHRDKTKSFLFSIIREPRARAMSQVFHFEIGAHRRGEPTDGFLQKELLQDLNNLYYYNNLGTRNYTNASMFQLEKEMARQHGFTSKTPVKDYQAIAYANETSKRYYRREWKQFSRYGVNFTPHKVIADILEDYNLIAIMERMDESLVVLQMLLNLTTKEILYTRARSAGAFSNGYPDRPCFYILPSFVSPGMNQFFESDEWQEHVTPDMELYKAAHKSLDRTIDALGREEVNKRLDDLRAGLKLAGKHCEGRVRTLCSPGGVQIRELKTTCYIWGEGCDHDCIDELEI